MANAADARSPNGSSWPSRGARLLAWLRSDRVYEALNGYLFITPVVLGFLVFFLGPTIAAIGLSFTDYEPLSEVSFIGVDNYVRMLSDVRLHTVYVNSFVYMVAAVVLMNGIALGLAYFLNKRLPRVLRYVLRSAYFFPSMVALVYVAIIWQFLLTKDGGVVNYYLSLVGLGPIDWLGSGIGAVTSVIIVDVWRNTGLALIIFLAALQDVPDEVTEAARIDGASEWRTFRTIVIPLISPAIFLNATLTIIGSLQIFESILILTRGGPGDSSRSVVFYVYEKGFQSFEMGYASAISITLFGVIIVLTLLMFRARRRWVHEG
ncbi:MAG: sugar ABC transporter permease [Acidimicrobiia bacterium]|nr:sugar ABC transporter permease [Acidimicrobiia bacterium]